MPTPHSTSKGRAQTCQRTPRAVRQLARAQPMLVQTMANQAGFPSFDDLVNAYRAIGADEQVRYLLEEEEHLRVF